MAVARVTLVVLVTLGLARTSLCCMCSPDHPQQDFCQADFVVKLVATHVEEIFYNDNPRIPFPKEIRYSIHIRHIYKGTENFENANQTYLLTGGTSSSCRQDLNLDTPYIITGRVDDGEMKFTMCDWFIATSDMTSRQRNFLGFKYEQACNQNCTIRTCYGKGCELTEVEPDVCLWENSNDCNYYLSYCSRHGNNGTCSWQPRSGRLQRCLNQLASGQLHTV